MAARRSKRPPKSDDPQPIQPEAAVILYNKRTGAISHTHFFSAVAGAKLPGKEELERVACAHAEQDGCDLRTHGAMHVDPQTLKRGTSYRISVKKKGAPALVAVRQPSKSRLASVAPRSAE